MRFFKDTLEFIFNLIYPVLKPEKIQRFLRRIGFVFPYYRFAQKLNYKGIVDFKVNGKTLFMQSYNCPFEMFIFWYGIFGYWEPVQLKLWSKLVTKAELIFDIGANNGVYSLIASTNTSAKIIAFEPVPAVIEMLDKNISLNLPNKIEVKQVVVGDKVGQAVLYIPQEGWVDVSSLDKKFAGQVYGNNTKLREYICNMVTVDSVFEESNFKNEQSVLFKIDVEQAEYMVLAGMAKTLDRDKVQFIIELLNADNFKKCRKLIPDSYLVYAVDEVKKSVYLVTQFTEGATNYLFTKTKVDFIF